jgi:hypothetical protein
MRMASLGWRGLAVTAGSVFAIVMGGGAALAQSQTTTTVIHLPAVPMTNLCNGDVVNLSGDLYITTTTTQNSNGSYTVDSVAAAPNLKGNRIAPLPPIGYKGQDVETSHSYNAPPPYPSSFDDYHYTKLVPQGKGPVMYLVVALRETVAPDGTTVPTLDKTYLVCDPRGFGGGGGGHGGD